MDMRLSDRVVVVTGASSGVGLATTRLLVAEGAHVIGCARDERRLADATRAIDGPGSVTGVAGDALREEDMRRVVDAAISRHGRLDGLVCNAGRSLLAPLDETSDEQIREEFDLKIFGTLNPVRAARPYLERSPVASVVVVNAILARQPEDRLPVTSAARAALLNLTKTLSNDLGRSGVRVNSVALGLIDTGQWRRRFENAHTELDYDSWSTQIAADRGIVLGRFGRAEEVAFPIATLLSPLSGYCTGSTIDVGGGVARSL